MMSPKLRQLQRQLLAEKPDAPASAVPDSKLLRVVQAAMEAETEATQRAEAAEAGRRTAETEVARLRAEVATLQAKLKEAEDEAGEYETKAQGKYDKACKDHECEMQKMEAEHEAMESELETYRQKCTQLQAQVDAMGSMREHMATMMSKLQPAQAAKLEPIIMPSAAKPFPFRLEVSARDANGRIAAITATPTT